MLMNQTMDVVGKPLSFCPLDDGSSPLSMSMPMFVPLPRCVRPLAAVAAAAAAAVVVAGVQFRAPFSFRCFMFFP